MTKYEYFGTISYWAVGKLIQEDINAHPDSNEFRFEKVPGAQTLFKKSYLTGKSPILNSCKFLDARGIKDLGGVLETVLIEGNLPNVVRVVRPDSGRNVWGIFFKQ